MRLPCPPFVTSCFSGGHRTLAGLPVQRHDPAAPRGAPCRHVRLAAARTVPGGARRAIPPAGEHRRVAARASGRRRAVAATSWSLRVTQLVPRTSRTVVLRRYAP